MRSCIKIASLILVAMFMLFTVTSCTSATSPNGDETGDATASPKDPLTITADYVIVRPESCSDAVATAVNALKDALTAAVGTSFNIKEDGEQKPAQYEVLVGQTDREESAKAIDSLKYGDYVVSIEGSKLVINAYNDEKLVEAIHYAISMIEKSSGTITFRDEDQKTFRAEYPLDDVKIADTSLCGYTMVIPTDASKQFLDEIHQLQTAVAEASGIYLPVRFDNAEETEKEILFGNTGRAASTSVDSEALGTYGYTIKSNGAKIVVKANDVNFTLMKTITNMTNDATDGKIAEATGNLKISQTPLLTSFMFSDVHNNFAMLEPTNDTGDYVVRKNVDEMIDRLLSTVGPIDVVLVGGDLMSDYHHWNKSGNWSYSYFVEYRRILVNTFKRLSKDGKVSYVAGNHDYAQGELATDGPGKNGSYNSSDFYFGDVGMRQDWGELPEEDMFVKVGEGTGEKYLLAYYYEVNGIGIVGLSPDHDKIWGKQGNGFDEECLEWLDKKLDEVDPYGNKVILVNCHYLFNHRTEIAEDGTNTYNNVQYVQDALTPIYLGHKNLYHIFGHAEVWYSDTTSRYVSHHDTAGVVMDVTGKETDSSQITSYENRDFTLIYGGHFRPDANKYPKWFADDFVTGFAGLADYGYTHRSTCTPQVGQGLYIEVYEDRIVFTMKNVGTVRPFSTRDRIDPYTVWLYK